MVRKGAIGRVTRHHRRRIESLGILWGRTPRVIRICREAAQWRWASFDSENRLVWGRSAFSKFKICTDRSVAIKGTKPEYGCAPDKFFLERKGT